MAEMKTLNGYEIVDEEARQQIDSLGGKTQTMEEMLQGFEDDPGAVKKYIDENMGEATVPDEKIAEAVENYLTENPIKGADGADGADGKSAYEIAVDGGFDGDEAAWLASLKGADGKDGADGAQGEPGKDGSDGADGKTPYIQDGYWYIDGTNTNVRAEGVDGKNGTDGTNGTNGTDGTNGQDGEDGVGIQSVVQTTTSTADGGENVITITLTNGAKSTFTVKNGSKGSTGDAGADGKDGSNGTNGTNGKDGTDGVGIKSIVKTSTSGLVDTYTVTLTNNTTATFTVTNGKDGVGKNGHTPVRGVDYWTPEDVAAIESENKAYIIEELSKRNQIRISVVQSVEEMTDTNLLYLMVKDGSLWYYAYTKVYKPAEPLFTNVLHTAVDKDGSIYNGIGYKDGWRTSESDGSYKEESGCTVTGYIACNKGDIVYMRGISIHSSRSQAMPYNLSFERYGNPMYGSNWTKMDNGDITFTATLPNASGYINVVGKTPFADDAVISLNNPIAYTDPTEIEEWTPIQPLIYTDHTEDIKALQNVTARHEQELSKLLAGSANAADIRTWDKPVYDVAPVTLLEDERSKPAATNADYTVEAVYAKYDALMAAHPDYVTTPIPFGQSAVNTAKAPNYKGHDLRCYEFREPAGVLEPGGITYETKPKIIFISGIHTEFAGVYGLYYALEEIASNPAFDDIRRNAHLIVMPCANPFCLSSQTVSGWTTSHVNANGVAIHNNFGVDHSTSGSVGAFNYGGTAPYSEPETAFIDSVMQTHKDAIAFVSCHNYDYDTYYGTRVIWGSSATAYMCNLVTRLADKMSKAWLSDPRYKDTLPAAIRNAWTGDENAVDYRLGYAQMSTSAGTEQKNALKYNIQATNLEIGKKMAVFSGDTVCSSEVLTRGAEVYANWIRTILANYAYNDKSAYTFLG